MSLTVLVIVKMHLATINPVVKGLVIVARLRGKSKKTAADLIIAAVDGVISV